MAESVFFKPVSITFAMITLIESLIWAVLSLLAILCYNDIVKYNSSKNYGLNLFMENLYNLYLSEKTFSKNDRLVTPDVFYILMWIYFLLSLFLLFTSGVHISVLLQVSNTRKINLSTIIWQFLTYTVCIYDIITCILFGVDYYLVRKVLNVDSAVNETKVAVILTLVVLSAKGFVLWIVNFVFSVVISVLFRNKIYDTGETLLRNTSEIYARNFIAYNAYGDMALDDEVVNINNNLKNSSFRPLQLEEEIPEPYQSINNHPWFTTLSAESSRRSYTIALSDRSPSPSNDPFDDTLTTTSTWSRIPRASSFRQPRSLVASLAPSPIPPPSKESPKTGRKSAPPEMWERDRQYRRYSSGYRSEDGRKEEDEYDDDILESMSKMSSVYPQQKRFNLNEPQPDY